MTSLSIFQPEIIDIETQMTALASQLEDLRQAENIATQLLATLADSLPRFEKLGAIARIKVALLGLFGESAAINPTFDAECLPQPENTALNRNPVRERFAKAFGYNYGDCAIAPSTLEVESTPTVEPVSTIEQMNYVELVQLNPTVAYQRKRDGEIVCAYLGAANQKLANNWAECLELWGCRAEVRKPKRLTDADIKYEVKVWGASIQQLTQLAANHTSAFQSVPAPKATAQVKKQNESSDQAGQPSTTGGNENDASNAPKPQVSLVIGKADNIYISYYVMVGDRTIGRVEKLSATSKWSVPGIPGTWETPEAAADALIAKREADKKLHDDTNAVLRAKYGLPA